MLKANSDFIKDGVQFQCQGSGNCCVSRGGYGYVYMNIEDRRRMAKVLGMPTRAFTQKYCDQLEGIWKLKQGSTDDCIFLAKHRCSVYEGRPMQCRTWPFWPEVLKPKAWHGEVAAGCPGIGKGKVWSREEVEEQLKLQMRSEDLYGS